MVQQASRRSGQLFQGRYKAFLVQEYSYLLAVVGYVHLNPVRAGLVKSPASYAWSSDRYYRRPPPPPWLDTAKVLTMLGATREMAVRRRLSGEDARRHPLEPMARQVHRYGSTLVRDIGHLEERLRGDSRLREKIAAISRTPSTTRE